MLSTIARMRAVKGKDWKTPKVCYSVVPESGVCNNTDSPCHVTQVFIENPSFVVLSSVNVLSFFSSNILLIVLFLEMPVRWAWACSSLSKDQSFRPSTETKQKHKRKSAVFNQVSEWALCCSKQMICQLSNRNLEIKLKQRKKQMVISPLFMNQHIL